MNIWRLVHILKKLREWGLNWKEIMQSQHLEDLFGKIKCLIEKWDESKDPRLMYNLSFNNYSNRVNKVNDENERKLKSTETNKLKK